MSHSKVIRIAFAAAAAALLAGAFMWPPLTALLYFFWSTPAHAQEDAAAEAPAAAYSPQGGLILPANYREWIYLSSGIDMSYRDPSTAQRSTFGNVFVDRRAYQAFLKTGTWPDQTVLLLEGREAANKGSINVRGHYQSGEARSLEAHVKDTKRFPGGWAFFSFNSTAPAAQIPASADCYSCHAQHAAVDTTFVQFYPTLLPVAHAHGTVKPEG